ncbi:YhdP family protein [Marinobacter caseinilyticus]|uniref:YhdP family protein n=1 Tax=Marinobacter caseinilyticus TaxID=2692195 RepID=UPI00140BF545|nr:YhdP family protein [Marinobacter caseinilyticus]
MSRLPADSTSRGPLLSGLLRAASLVWWLVFTVLVLLALYAGGGRQLTQHIDNYRTDLENRLSQELGQSVTIDSLSARWQWLDPILEARNLTIQRSDSAEPAAQLRHLRIRLDSLASLLRFRVVFREFEADGLDLTLSRTAHGKITIDGIDALGELDQGLIEDIAESSAQVWVDRLGAWLSDPFIRITRVNLGIKVPGDPVQHLDIPQADLTYDNGLFQASGRAMRSGTTEQVASFNLSGHHFFRSGFDGRLYLDVNSGRLFDGLVKGLGWKHLAILGFDVSGQGWLTFEKGRLIRGQGKVRMPFLQLAVDRETLAPIESITADVGWRPSRLGTESKGVEFGELHLRNLSWRWSSIDAPPFDVMLTLANGEWLVAGQGIPAGPVRRLAVGLQLLPGDAAARLARYQPRGTLNNVVLSVPSYAGDAFAFSAALADVSIQPVNGAPGVIGLSGQLTANQDGGRVTLASNNAELNFPELFLEPWTFSALSATVSWVLDDHVTRVFSDNIELAYQEATAFTGRFDLRLDKQGEDTLGLQVGLQQATAGMLADFVPAKVVNAALYDWLTTSITAATISEGVFYGHGLIGAESSAGSFTSSMNFKFQDATVRYNSDWPVVSGVRGEVDVHNGRADVRLSQGITDGVTLNPTAVQVGRNTEGVTGVTVTTSASLSGDTANRWLSTTPLAAMAGAAGESVTLGGRYDVELELMVPLDADHNAEVDLVVTTQTGEVRYADTDLTWSELAGRIQFNSREGFTGSPLQGRFMGDAVTVQLALDDSNGRLRIVQNGRLSVSGLLQLAEMAPETQTGVAGDTDYTASLSVMTDGAPVLAIESSLRGLAIDWPAPLSKSSGETAPLNVTVDWASGRGAHVVGNWQQRLGFNLQWQGQRFQRGRIGLEANSVSLPDKDGLVIFGPLAQLDVERWHTLWRQRSVAIGGDRDAVYTWLRNVDLNVGRLLLAGRAFSSISIHVRPEPYGWILEAQSDQVVGRILVPSGATDAVQVNMTKLVLPRTESDDTTETPLTVPEQVAAFRRLGLGTWPDIQVQIDTLVIDEENLGSWLFRVEPEHDTLFVKSLEGQLNALTFKGELAWRILDETPMTSLAGEMTGGSLAGLSSLVDGEVPFRNTKSQMLVDVSWQGGPDSVDYQSLNGTVSMRFDNGVILEQNNTAQMFRVFNLLNSDTLLRRLKLDFSDLYEAGVAFDAISGKAKLSDGTLTWDPEMQIVGPSGAFKLSGTTSLVDESLDMRLVVVLPLTQNLPLAALLLGASAPIGGALFVLDKVLGDPLSKLTSATYSVKGTWSNPDVRLRSVFDTGK